MATYTIKFDKKRCIACDACLVHCKVKNKVPEGLSLNRLFVEGPYADDEGKPTAKIKYQNCRHCKKPQCVPACPTGALSKREDGLVLVDLEKCDGCKECIEACPWQIPVFNSATGKIMKCDYCVDRIEAGLEPACVTGCTTKALSFIRK
ncbi:MAG: 4Fe-4S dicluster domain-containing protein [Desulfovibrionaceae bacterium]|nr:4Fe-4S dicluster domain-containing protein [Desulfovibrionaceae bacterium]